MRVLLIVFVEIIIAMTSCAASDAIIVETKGGGLFGDLVINGKTVPKEEVMDWFEMNDERFGTRAAVVVRCDGSDTVSSLFAFLSAVHALKWRQVVVEYPFNFDKKGEDEVIIWK